MSEKFIINRKDFGRFLEVLKEDGFIVVGPTIRDGAVIYDEIESENKLPIGWGDEQSGGSYRLKRRKNKTLFGYTVSSQSWKRYLNPPVQSLWKAKRNGKGFKITENNVTTPKYAFLGLRACELHAILIQDRVFIGDKYIDTLYKNLRENALIIAVNCTAAGENCFCTSMNTGPDVRDNFDIALTELIENENHHFVAEGGTERGIAILEKVTVDKGSEIHTEKVDELIEKTAQSMGKNLDTKNLKEILYANYDNPRWQKTAERCLSCTNCTMVCPTCFCHTVEDVTDLTGSEAERVKKWDSCFNLEFSYIHGGSARTSTSARYRHWLMHKLATWHDQFGTSGCVGCGRCIAWCPVGIDITEEAAAIRESSE